VITKIALNSKKDRECTVIFINGLVDQTLVDVAVLKPLIQEDILEKPRNENDVIDYIMLGTVYHCQRRLREKFNDCLADLFSGSVVLVFDKTQKAVTFDLKGFERRNITEPTNENVIKGSKESFIEVLRVNTSLIRRRIQTSKLKINQLTVGKRTNTTLAVVFLEDVAIT
jgi:spore germination protein KA